MVSRGDVWLVLPPSDSASGNGDPHPCVILSPPEIHDYLGVVTVAPISHGGARAAFRVPLTFANQTAFIRLEQITTVEKRALTRQAGTLDRRKLLDAIENGGPYPTIVGPIDLKTHVRGKQWGAGQWQGGQFVGIAPADLPGAKPIIFPKPAW